MSIYTDIFNAGFNVYTFLTQKSNSSIKHKKLVIREMRDNMKRLEHKDSLGVDHAALIKLLSNEAILDAIGDGFNFNKIASKRFVGNSEITLYAKSARYKGWDFTNLISSIDEKIVSLRDIQKIYKDLSSSSINISARLNNLHTLLVICVLLLKRKK